MIAQREILLTLRNVTTGYDSDLFSNLNLDLAAGELICFMGPNGAGKSTLLRSMAGLHRLRHGSIAYTEGKPVAHAVAVVLTDPVRSHTLTVEELVAFGRYPYLGWRLRLSSQDNQTLENALALLNLKSLRNRRIDELSDGQFQMAMIARALAQDTRILLLDEPTSHLDLNNRLEIMNVLRRTAREQHKAILVTTHELDLALQTADGIWLAGSDGTIISGLPEDLVLNDSFDKIFRFKGYDLKTGRIEHPPFRGKRVSLAGAGHAMLWTKNALERSGFTIVDANADGLRIRIEEGGQTLQWVLETSAGNIPATTLSELIRQLDGHA